jgi:hypothetical protein
MNAVRVGRIISPRFFAAAVILGLSVVQAGAMQAAQRVREPLTADQIASAIGSDADARTVISMFLQESFPPSVVPKAEFFLRSQVRDEWLPRLENVQIVQLSEADAKARLGACDTYWVLDVYKTKDDRIRVTRQPKCTASAQGTNFAIRDGEWRAVGRGIGSGWIGGPPAECLRCMNP